VAGDVPSDGGGRGIVLLLEGYGALDIGVTTENSDYQTRLSVSLNPIRANDSW